MWPFTLFKKVKQSEVEESISTGITYNASITAATLWSLYEATKPNRLTPATITILDICSGKEIAIPEIIEKVGYDEIYYKMPSHIARDNRLSACYYVDADGIMRLDKELLEACMSVEIVR